MMLCSQDRIELTQDDLQVLRRCNYESFWYRCFPIAAGLSVATHLAVQNGKPERQEHCSSSPHENKMITEISFICYYRVPTS